MENHKFDDQFISTMRGLYYGMSFLGLWPGTSSRKWYNFIWYVQSLTLAFPTFGCVAGLIVQRHDMRKIINNMGLPLLFLTLYAKWITFHMRRNLIQKLLDFMEEDWINLQKDTLINLSVKKSERIMRMYSRFTKIFFYNYVIMSMLYITNYELDSITKIYSRNNATDLGDILLIPNSWYPLDYNRSFNIQFLSVAETITSIISALASVSMDSFCCAVTLHFCGQFEILRHFIEGITYDSSKPKCCEREVKLMVERHETLLNLGEEIEEIFDFIVLEHLMGSTVAICFLGYTVLAEMESSTISTTALLKTGFLCVNAVQITFAYCFIGDFVAAQSAAIAMSVYNVEWYNCPQSIKLSFSIVMIRARKPVTLSGAGLVPMTLENFTAIMKAIASYLSVLRAIGMTDG